MQTEILSHQSLPIKLIDLGRMRYGEALALQETAHSEVAQGDGHHIIFSVEHEPVLTMGKNADQGHLLFPREFYQKQGVEIFDTERGGQVTAHMPGQLVIYPILNMSALKLSIREYVHILEESVIQTLAGLGIQAHRDSEHPGVWIGHEKICALGVRIKNRTSMHGLALNVNNDLALFGKIIPCGIKFRGVTSIERQRPGCHRVEDVKQLLISEILLRLAHQ